MVHGITDQDRQAAHALREELANICGFWHSCEDDSPLCRAMARHRIEAERRMAAAVIAAPLGPRQAHARGVTR